MGKYDFSFVRCVSKNHLTADGTKLPFASLTNFFDFKNILNAHRQE